MQQAATQHATPRTTSTGTQSSTTAGSVQAKKLPQAAIGGCNQPHQTFAP